MIFAAFMVAWGASDAAPHWTAPQWTLAIALWSPPFLIAAWIVYRLLSSLKHFLISQAAVIALLLLAFWCVV